jgi:hypothetical protein
MSIAKIGIIILPCLFAGSVAHAACPRLTAPSQFDNPKDWGNDSGPVVAGFVDSKRPKGGLFDLVHGVDLDSYNTVDYSKIVECSGKFAIVRINNHKKSKDNLDELFTANISGLAKQHIAAFPYYYFALPSELKTIKRFNNKLSDSDKARFVRDYESAGSSAAQKFMSLMSEAKYDVPIIDIAGLRGQFVSVDVEERPLDEKQANQTAKAYYATFYGAAVCSWIKTVAAAQHQLLPVLYTFPGIYGEYLQFADADVNACLEGLPVWIARTYGSGWEAIRNTDTAHCQGPRSVCVTDQYVEKLCEIQGGNRCIIHQYTHRGTAIAVGVTPKNGVPPHIDFDRFYTSKTVPNNVGTHYVRVEDAFRQ